MKKANSTDIHFHVDEETNSILQEKLQETQLTPSAFLRKLIRDGQITYTPYGKEMLIQLAKTHNEVNQGMLAIDNEISNLSRVCQEFCVNFFRNLYHTSTLIRSYDHL